MSIESGRRKRTWSHKEDPVLEQARLLARRDEDRFIENFLYIKTKDAQLSLLRPNQEQRVVGGIIRELEKQRRPIRLFILKSRQVGMSTYCAAKVFTRIYRDNNVEGMIIGHRKDATAKLLQKCHLFYQMLPEALQIPLVKSTTDSIRYASTQSGLSIITGGSKNASRSSTNLIVLATEVAFYEDLFGQMGSLEQTVPYIPSSFIAMETTANGAGTAAHHHWESCGTITSKGEIKTGDNAYVKIFLPWYEDPQYRLPEFSSMRTQAAFVEQMFSEFPSLKERMEFYGLDIQQIGWYYETLKFKCYSDELLMCQEYPCDAEEAWISSGTPVFPVQLLGQYRLHTKLGYTYSLDGAKKFKRLGDLKEDQDIDREDDKYLEVWEPPVSGQRYLIGADGAAGYSDGDYSSAFVINRKTLNMVAEVHGRFEPDEFAHILGSLGHVYNDAIVAPETNGVGLAVLAALQQFYWRIYQWRMIDSYGLKTTNRLGWDTNSQSRPIMITETKRIFKERSRTPGQMGAFIPSKLLIEELRTFTVSGLSGKPEAQSGCHDDRVMAWCIAVICTLQEEYGMLGGDEGKPVGESPSSSKTSNNSGPKMEDVLGDVLALDW